MAKLSTPKDVIKAVRKFSSEQDTVPAPTVTADFQYADSDTVIELQEGQAAIILPVGFLPLMHKRVREHPEGREKKDRTGAVRINPKTGTPVAESYPVGVQVQFPEDFGLNAFFFAQKRTALTETAE